MTHSHHPHSQCTDLAVTITILKYCKLFSFSINYRIPNQEDLTEGQSSNGSPAWS